MNKEGSWTIKEVEESLYDPQVAVTTSIGEIVENKSFKDHFKWKFGQLFFISFGIGALAFFKFKVPEDPKQHADSKVCMSREGDQCSRYLRT